MRKNLIIRLTFSAQFSIFVQAFFPICHHDEHLIQPRIHMMPAESADTEPGRTLKRLPENKGRRIERHAGASSVTLVMHAI
jgi:hypothetical protein